MVKYFLYFAAINLLLIGTSCYSEKRMNPSTINQNNAVPTWAKDAIWYQIFVERFRNGSENNNPTRASLKGAWPEFIPETWAVTPWTQDWYQPDPWFKDCADDQFYHGTQARRYGGDLIGVKQKIDYLSDLGINAIYFNPLNDAPSLHKYDPAHYRHIDRHFGPDPVGDAAIIAGEIPDDPSTWKWTSADLLFLDIVKTCHELGIRVILDYSWNHTGRNFWAFEDVKKNGEQSKYKDWYYIKSFDKSNTETNEFEYQGWAGVPSLPELKEELIGEHSADGRMAKIEGDIYSASLKEHIYHVSRRWLDPNGDGNVSDGIDGFRLDVAAEIPAGFWKGYRSMVKSINPEAILIGEIWWELWPDDLLDPAPFLEDAFDAVMNYRWYREARRLIAQAGVKTDVATFKKRLSMLNKNIPEANQYAMMNLLGSHDSPRVLTSLYNKNKYKFNSKPTDDPTYKTTKPDQVTEQTLKLMLIHQFTYIGAPHIWNGDEMGMWGADDPDCRKPLIWDDLTFEDEKMHPIHGDQKPQLVKFKTDLFNFYKKVIAIRNDNSVLRQGPIEFINVDPDIEILAYRRFNDTQEIITILNLSDDTWSGKIKTRYNNSYTELLSEQSELTTKQGLLISLKSNQGQIWSANKK